MSATFEFERDDDEEHQFRVNVRAADGALAAEIDEFTWTVRIQASTGRGADAKVRQPASLRSVGRRPDRTGPVMTVTIQTGDSATGTHGGVRGYGRTNAGTAVLVDVSATVHPSGETDDPRVHDDR